jgi:hypothetical protein
MWGRVATPASPAPIGPGDPASPASSSQLPPGVADGQGIRPGLPAPSCVPSGNAAASVNDALALMPLAPRLTLSDPH